VRGVPERPCSGQKTEARGQRLERALVTCDLAKKLITGYFEELLFKAMRHALCDQWFEKLKSSESKIRVTIDLTLDF